MGTCCCSLPASACRSCANNGWDDSTGVPGVWIDAFAEPERSIKPTLDPNVYIVLEIHGSTRLTIN